MGNARKHFAIIDAAIAASEDEEASIPYVSSVPSIIINKKTKQIQEPQSAAASEFISVVNDDLLLEIFLRLPHGRYVIQCAAVCKRWHSLITNSHDIDKFIHRFIQYHLHKQSKKSLDSSYYPAYVSSILFKCCILESKSESTSTNTNTTSSSSRSICNLNFLPGWPILEIRASYNDLLLVSSRFPRNDYICNQLTRQWLALPEFPLRPHDVFSRTLNSNLMAMAWSVNASRTLNSNLSLNTSTGSC
ncbi:hypothetical protein L484_021409 [Morus notabilis]|uniref:F-box domain-containing protein n=1 Tax=Morus notabilis TaxID=981085 RepID=W9S6K6_9ROSA|nr:hypothetical protein L484_021409 [Morus notabilis]